MPLDQQEKLLEAISEIKDLLAEMNKYRFAEQYITNEELTVLLKISTRTAQEWRQANLLPFARIGKKIYYRLSDLDAMFRNEFEKQKRFKKKTAPIRSRLKKPVEGNGWTIKV